MYILNILTMESLLDLNKPKKKLYYVFRNGLTINVLVESFLGSKSYLKDDLDSDIPCVQTA